MGTQEHLDNAREHIESAIEEIKAAIVALDPAEKDRIRRTLIAELQMTLGKNHDWLASHDTTLDDVQNLIAGNNEDPLVADIMSDYRAMSDVDFISYEDGEFKMDVEPSAMSTIESDERLYVKKSHPLGDVIYVVATFR